MMTSRGKLWWKKYWISFCSEHGMKEDPKCSACNTGHWTNAWGLKISQKLYNICPPLWRWWMGVKKELPDQDLMEARLGRIANLSKETIDQAKELQAKLRDEDKQE